MFSQPLEVTNPFAPVEPGATKLFRGQLDGQRLDITQWHLTETRLFPWNGAVVERRVVEQKEFLRGSLVEITHEYLAQDDAGNAHRFGEVSLVFEHGVLVETEEDSWLTGGPVPGVDPPDVRFAEGPSLFMPADPQPGDSFDQESAPGMDEILQVVVTGRRLPMPAGLFEQAMLLRELDDGEDGAPPKPPGYRWGGAGCGAGHGPGAWGLDAAGGHLHEPGRTLRGAVRRGARPTDRGAAQRAVGLRGATRALSAGRGLLG